MVASKKLKVFANRQLYSILSATLIKWYGPKYTTLPLKGKLTHMGLNVIICTLLPVILIVVLEFGYVQAQEALAAHFLFAPDYGMSKEQLQIYESLMPAAYAQVTFTSAQNLSLDCFSLETRYKELLQLLNISQLKAKRDGTVILGIGHGATAALTATATGRLAFLKALVVESPVDPLARALIDYGQELFTTSPEDPQALQPLLTQALSDPAAWYASTPRATTQSINEVYPISSIQHIDRSLPLLFMIQRNDTFYQKNTTRLLYIKLKQAKYPHVYLLDLEDVLDTDTLSAGTRTSPYVAAVHAFYKKYDIPHDILLATEGQQYLAQARPSIESIEQTILGSYIDNAFVQKVLLTLAGAKVAVELGSAVAPTVTKAIEGLARISPAPDEPAAKTSWSDTLKSVYDKLSSKFKGLLFFGKDSGPSELEAGGFLMPTVPKREVFKLHILPLDMQEPSSLGTLTEIIKPITAERRLKTLNDEVRNFSEVFHEPISILGIASAQILLKKSYFATINRRIEDLPFSVRQLIKGESLGITTEAEEQTRTQLSPQACSYIEHITNHLPLIEKSLNNMENEELLAQLGDTVISLEAEINQGAQTADEAWLKKMQEELVAIEGQIQALPPLLKNFIEAEVLKVKSAKIRAASGLARLIQEVGSKLASMSNRLTEIRQDFESKVNQALIEAARKGGY